MRTWRTGASSGRVSLSPAGFPIARPWRRRRRPGWWCWRRWLRFRRARAVVVLRYWADLSVEQVADVLGCSAGNVKSLSARALPRLRAVLDEALAEPGPPSRPPLA